MREIDFSNGTISINKENIEKVNELLKTVVSGNIAAKKEFLTSDVTNDNQLDIKIFAQYDPTAFANAIMGIFEILKMKFKFDYGQGSMCVDETEEYYITQEMLAEVNREIGQNFAKQMQARGKFINTRERECIKYEVELLECIDRFSGYLKALECFNMFPSPHEKATLYYDPEEIGEVKKAEEMFNENRSTTRDFIVRRLKNYNDYLKALVALENAKEELNYQGNFVLDQSKYQALVDECEERLREIKDEYTKIDEEDRNFGNNVVRTIHGSDNPQVPPQEAIAPPSNEQ